MHVRKAEINIVDVDVDPRGGDVVRFAKIRPEQFGSMNSSASTSSVEYETWRLKKMVVPGGTEMYLVRVDQDGLFNDLLMLSNESLNKMIEKMVKDRTHDWKEQELKHLRDARVDALDSVRQLPWWKRLFNRF